MRRPATYLFVLFSALISGGEGVREVFSYVQVGFVGVLLEGGLWQG